MILLIVDSQTWIITVVGWIIVFIALVVLILVFTYVPKVLNIKFKREVKSLAVNVEFDAGDNKYISGDETAAISLALHLFFDEQHDEESNVITIKQIQRRYSPWSSKIYGVRNFPNK